MLEVRKYLAALLCGTAACWVPTAAHAQSISARSTLFFGQERLQSGNFDSLLQVGLTGRTAELLPGLTLEADVSLLVTGGPGIGLSDDSSFLRLRWHPASWAKDDGLVLTVLPLDARRLYVGWEFPLVSEVGPLLTQKPVTGAKLRLDRGPGYAFLAAKSGMVYDNLKLEARREYTVILGGGLDVLPALRVELEGAHGGQGINPDLAGQAHISANMSTWVAAGRVMFHRGSSIGPPTDFFRYQDDPAVWKKLMRPEQYDGGLSTAVSATVLFHRHEGLESPEEFGKTEGQSSLGFALEGRLKWKRLRAWVRGQYRSFGLLTAPTPGLPPVKAIPIDTTTRPEIRVMAALDYQFRKLRLTPGLELEVKRPASLTAANPALLGGSPPPGEPPRQTVVIPETGVFSVFSDGREPSAVYRAKVNLRWDLAQFSAIGEGFLTDDPNRTTFKDSATGIAEPTFDTPTSFGFDVLLQARF